jgi:hypothetical protein
LQKELAAATPNPLFRDSVLPRRLDARSFWCQPSGFQESDDLSGKDRIVVQDCIAIWTRVGEGFLQLLHDPIPGRMPCHMKWRILRHPCSITKKQYSTAKVNVGTVKKSNAANRLSMVFQERTPPLSRSNTPLETPEIAGDGPLGHGETDFLELAVDSRRPSIRRWA